MTAKDLIQSLKNNLERESLFTDSEVIVNIQSSDEKSTKATLRMYIEGKIHLLEIHAKDLGVFEGIN